MRFFEHQQEAKRVSRRLLWLYSLAVTVVVVLTATFLTAMMPVFFYIFHKTRDASVQETWASTMSYYHEHIVAFWAWPACMVLAFVVGATLIKLSELSKGGRVVAEAFGGQQVQPKHATAQERRLLNVVEEMAIAAGLPMPKVYIIDEDDINAFAAGVQPTDAVIAVTRGALDTLSRDELQAVIAHEFSHILNGDMNINMYLTGLLYGLEMLWLLGYKIWNGREEDDASLSLKIVRSFHPLFFTATVIMLLGLVGSVLAGWIRAAVSRQREFLADASSVRFTRQKDNLLGALMKMAKAPHGMRHHRATTAEYAHFFFGSVQESWLSQLSATHPPLIDRMSRLDAQQARVWAQQHPYTLRKITKGRKRRRNLLVAGLDDDDTLEPTRKSYWLQPLSKEQTVLSAPSTPCQKVLADVQYLNPAHIQYAAWLHRSIPEAWYQASQDGEKATALMCILLLSDEAEVRASQQALIVGYDRPLSLRVQGMLLKMPNLTRELVLPLLDLILPALAGLPENERKALRQLWQRLITADNRLDLHEWCVWTVLTAHLRGERTNHYPTRSWQSAAPDIGIVLAYSAHINDADTATDNYHTVAQTLPDVTLPAWEHVAQVSIMDLQAAVQRLAQMNNDNKARALQAVLSAIQANGRIDVAEREWMRALTAVWHYPMPPLLPQTQAFS